MRLELKNVGFRYGGADGTGRRYPWLFRGVNLSFEGGCRTVLLGDSGSGKTTLGRLMARHEIPCEGEITVSDTPAHSSQSAPSTRSAVFGKGCYPVQLILQHPETAVNPRFKMRDILNEGWQPDSEMLDRLGIERSWLDRYPQELSGGELQRFCIARALAPPVRFIIADEITAMFDLITQAQIWDALLTETAARGLGLIVITHDRELARRLSPDTILMDDIIGR
ncbi:MAG: ATP-binding cassette domain-containing protein [Spirochaetaceae bacterium]|jgi:peptide/nickel transport system ATP-binding protein|nr:ATP-binding cassette domain-containing protein [Spirochaetaceae bacterium]